MRELHVNPETLTELARIGISTADLATLLRSKTEAKMKAQGLSVKIPLREPFDVFISNFKRGTRAGGGRSELSLDTYQKILEKFYKFTIDTQRKDGAEVGILDTSTVGRLANDFLKHIVTTRNLQPVTHRKYAAILRSFIFTVADYYRIDVLGVPKSPPVGFRRLPLALPEDEVPNLFRIAKRSRYGRRSNFMVSMFLGLGLRRMEFLGLKVSDIKFNAGTVHVVGKGNKERYIVLPDPLKTVIIDYFDASNLGTENYVYPSLYNIKEQTTPQAIDKHTMYLMSQLSTYKKNDPIHQYHLHSLRHTYATTLFCNGVDLTLIQKAMGHNEVSTTQIYTELDVRRMREQLQPGLDAMRSWWDV